MARHQRIPYLLPWNARRDCKDVDNEVEEQAAPDANLNGNQQRHVAIAGGYEDPEILEENGKLDKEDDDAIENL